MLRLISLIFSLVWVLHSAAQSSAWPANKASVDSLLADLKDNGCFLIPAKVKMPRKETALDVKLFRFLEDFYSRKLDQPSINTVLKKKFQQGSPPISSVKKFDSLTMYQGRIRSNGNIQAFIGYIVYKDTIVGRRFFFRVRTYLDCSQEHGGDLEDWVYLSQFIPGNINIPLNFADNKNYFHSYINKATGLPKEIEAKIDELLSIDNTL